MAQRITLSKGLKNENLSYRFSDDSVFIHIADDFLNRLFLCFFSSYIYYLTKIIVNNVYFTKKS